MLMLSRATCPVMCSPGH